MGAGVMIGRMTHGEFLIAMGKHCDSHTDNSRPDAGLDQAPMVQDDKAGER